MQYKITFPNRLKNMSVPLPASKSISARALIINALSDSKLPVNNTADCDDTNALTAALASSGTHFDIGAAGTAMRFLTAFFAHRPGEWTITGSKRMQQRPIALLVEALNSLGASVEYVGETGFPPLNIHGRKLRGGEVKLPGNVSSQYISALLLIAPMMEEGLTVNLSSPPTSIPYINLTIGLMRSFGAMVEWVGERCIQVWPKPYIPVPFTVESDWSAASYWYSMVSLSDAEIMLEELSEKSMQGDAEIVSLYKKLGVDTLFTNAGAVIRRNVERCTELVQDFASTPDIAQTLAVGCCLLDIPFRFTGLHTLRIKETDRIAALISELGKLGYILESPDGASLAWNGRRQAVDPSPINTYEDHRMAMSFAPAALVLNEGIDIADPQVVTKSYPQYWQHIAEGGAEIQQIC
jgi:3-phosphoshikimate 1-carboxyvinyltransferase